MAFRKQMDETLGLYPLDRSLTPGRRGLAEKQGDLAVRVKPAVRIWYPAVTIWNSTSPGPARMVATERSGRQVRSSTPKMGPHGQPAGRDQVASMA
jgi:hypothetical protein